MFWSAGCSLFRAEGFYCSLCVLYEGLWISKYYNFRSKKYKKFYSFKFFPIFGNQNPGFGTGSGSTIRNNAGSGSALNQCGSTTLHGRALSPFCRQCWGSEMIVVRIRIRVLSTVRYESCFVSGMIFFYTYCLLQNKLPVLFVLKIKKIYRIRVFPDLDEKWLIRIRNWGFFYPWIRDPGRDRITINVPLFKKLRHNFFLRDNHFMSHFKGHFEGAKTFLTP